jgi:hypothetical protein
LLEGCGDKKWVRKEFLAPDKGGSETPKAKDNKAGESTKIGCKEWGGDRMENRKLR